MIVNTKQAKELLTDSIKAKLVPMLAGSPGIGKSDVIRSIAKEFRLKVIDMRLSQCDPTDLLGFPTVDKETGKAGYRPMDTFPLEGDAIPDGYNGWLLFLDEMNGASKAVQMAAYKLVLDREVGQQKLHPHLAMIGAGNLDTDNAIVNAMSTAMQSRMVHLEMGVDHEAWLEWASGAHVDYRVISYINFKPDELYKFNPDHDDKTFACPRTWEMVSKLIKDWGTIPHSKLPLLAGTISEGAARQFTGFCEIFQDLPTIAQIVANPTGINVPTEPSTCYALSGSIGVHANKSNIDALMKFIWRLPLEFQIVTMKDFIKREPTMLAVPAVKDWTVKNAKDLF